jgi:CubicO group peptidase (beta-lactamase class C family)
MGQWVKGAVRIWLAIAFVTPIGVAAQRGPLAGFDAYVSKALKDWRVPGMSIVVVKDDSVLFMKGYGVRELGQPDPVSVHTRFGNMSTTKAFTAMLVAMMADSLKVGFDDPVSKHVPAFQVADPYVTREVSVRDLLTHRVGFPDPGYLWESSGLVFDEMLRRLRFVPRSTSFRSAFEYNNVTYALAGEIAARAASTSWQALMRDRIYIPLGMAESYPDAASMIAAGVTDVTAPHGIVKDTVRVLPAAATVVDPIAPAGSAFSTAADMAKWLRFLLDSGKVAGKRLVSARNFQQLFSAQQIVPFTMYPTATLTRPRMQAYGMGWFLQDYRGEFVAFHTGSIEGRSAIVGLIPDRRLGVAVFTNLDHSELRHALMYTVFDRFIDRPGPKHDWSTEMLELYKGLADSAAARVKAQESRRLPNTKPSLPLDRYAGTYADSLFGTALVRLVDGRLTFETGTQRGDFEHWQNDTFRLTWNDPFRGATYFTFTIEPDSTVGLLTGAGRRFRRVK